MRLAGSIVKWVIVDVIYFLITLNLSLAVTYSAIKYWRSSPFYLLPLFLSGLVIAPAYLEPINQVVHFHHFSHPIVITYEILYVSHLLIFAVLLAFLALEILGGSPTRVSVFSEGIPHSLVAPLFGLLLCICLAIFSYGFTAIAALNFTEMRESGIGIYGPLIAYLSVLSATLPAIFWYGGNKLLSMTALSVIVFLVFFVGGSRQALALSILMFAMYQQRSWKVFVLVSVTIIFFFPVVDQIFTVTKQIRNLPSFNDRIDFLLSSSNWMTSEASSESTLRYVFYTIMQNGGVGEGGGQFSYLIRTILFWLPSKFDLIGLKPADFEYVIFAATMGNRQGTMHATFFGQVFADSEWLFLLWVVFAFFIMRMIEIFITRLAYGYDLYIWGVGCYISLMWSRGSLYAPMVIFMASTLLVFLMSKFPTGNSRHTA